MRNLIQTLRRRYEFLENNHPKKREKKRKKERTRGNGANCSQNCSNNNCYTIIGIENNKTKSNINNINIEKFDNNNNANNNARKTKRWAGILRTKRRDVLVIITISIFAIIAIRGYWQEQFSSMLLSYSLL